jgi:hypothetical protein
MQYISNLLSPCVSNALHETVRYQSCVTPEIAFPDSEDTPSELRESFLVSAIAPDRSFEFIEPERSACCRCRGKAATFVAMPVATLHAHNGTVFAQYDVRAARQRADVLAKAKACSVE